MGKLLGDKIMKAFKDFDLGSKIVESSQELGLSQITKVNPDLIAYWEYTDRRDDEYGNLDELCESIKKNGQAQPIVITPINQTFKPKGNYTNEQYIVIAGRRRLGACKKGGIEIQAIVRHDFSFEEALSVLMTENDKKNVSDYSKGLLYKKLIQEDKITQNELSNKLSLNKNKISNFLAFTELPQDLVDAIGDMSHISARTAGYIRSLLKKGDHYEKALIQIADLIRDGAGERAIEKAVQHYLKNEKQPNKTKPANIIDSFKLGSEVINVYNNGKIKLPTKITSDVNYQNFVEDFKQLLHKHFNGSNDE